MSKSKQTRRRLVAPKKKKSAPRATQELGFVAKALRGLGGLGGSTLGSFLGAPVAGATVGHGLGAALSRWLGMGDYSVHQNTIVQRASSSIPNMHKNDQTVVIRHREYIGPISGTSGFTVAYELPLNPGLQGSFPWLSGIAQNFQEYKIRGAVYHYVPTSGMAISGTNSALGSVMMQTSYRATETAPASKTEMLNEYWANEVVPSDTMAHPIECDPKENPFAVHYVRSIAVPGSELLLYDMGKTFVATQGMQGTNVVGDLWVTYEVELKKPMVSSSAVAADWYSARYLASAGTNLFTGAGPLGVQGGLPITASANTITFPKGIAGNFTITVDIRNAAGNVPTSAWFWGATADVCTNCFLTTRIATDGILPPEQGTRCENTSTASSIKGASYTVCVRKTDANTVATIAINAPLLTGLFEWTGLVVNYRSLE